MNVKTSFKNPSVLAVSPNRESRQITVVCVSVRNIPYQPLPGLAAQFFDFSPFSGRGWRLVFPSPACGVARWRPFNNKNTLFAGRASWRNMHL